MITVSCYVCGVKDRLSSDMHGGWLCDNCSPSERIAELEADNEMLDAIREHGNKRITELEAENELLQIRRDSLIASMRAIHALAVCGTGSAKDLLIGVEEEAWKQLRSDD